MDFSEAKRKKNRGMSNSEFLDFSKPDLLNSQTMVIISYNEDGNITTFQTSDSQLISLGMIEVAKKQLLDDMENA